MIRNLIMAAAGAATEVDPLDRFCVLRLPCNGAEGDTVFTDRRGHVFTAVGAKITRVVDKFGTGCADLTSSARVYTPASPDWALGAGDFTIRFWINVKSSVTNSFVMAAGSGWGIEYSGSYGIRMSSSFGYKAVASATPAYTVWAYLSLCRADGMLHFHRNGVFLSSLAAAGTVTSTDALTIGAKYSDGRQASNIYIRDVEIFKGLALYSGAGYEAPTEPLL